MTTILGTLVTSPATTTNAATPAYSINIEVSTPSSGTEIFRGRAYYRLRFEAVSSTGGLPLEVFVHRRISHPLPDDQVRIQDDLVSVAGPLDLVNISTDIPNDDGYIRLSHADLLIESVNLAGAVVDEIRNALTELLDGLRRLDIIEVTDAFTIES